MSTLNFLERLLSSPQTATGVEADAAQMATAAEAKADYDAALDHWRAYRAQNPAHALGYLEPSKLLCRLERYAEAEALFTDAFTVCAERLVLMIEYAWVAHREDDLVNALARWKAVDAAFPAHPAGAVGIGRVLFQSRDFDEAEQHLQSATRRFPGDPHLAETFARVASARENWQEALRRWQICAALAPLSESALSDRGICQWQLKMQADVSGRPSLSRLHSHNASGNDDGQTTPERDLLTQFESIGENCEFGMVQRHFGAEPVDLLRWTSITPAKLINLLEARAAGLGDKANIFLSRTRWHEYMVNDAQFGIGFHTFSNAQIADEAKFFAHQSTRIRWLRQLLLENLSNARKIYVYKVHHGASDAQMLRVFSLLRGYGDNKLLWVKRADARNAAGTISHLAPGLWEGYISRSNPSDEDIWDIPFGEWLSICAQARQAAYYDDYEPVGSPAAAP